MPCGGVWDLGVLGVVGPARLRREASPALRGRADVRVVVVVERIKRMEWTVRFMVAMIWAAESRNNIGQLVFAKRSIEVGWISVSWIL